MMRKSISEMRPDLASEWSMRNGSLTPDLVTYGSNKLYWWKGLCGHEWQASAKARSSGEKCPICSNIRIVPGLNDLESQCPELAKEWSPKNTFTPDTVGIGSHKKAIWQGKCGHEWETEIRYRVNGSSCPYCSHNKVLVGFNDLKTLCPKVAREWSPKNKPLRPTEFTAYSNKKVLWRCRKGHEWEAQICTRSYGSKCPYCSGRKLMKGFNDLATEFPQLAAEWSSKNKDLLPDMVNRRSIKNVWWHCNTCGHEYRAVIKSKVNGLMCPVCADREIKAGINDLATTDPELLSEWDYQKNRMKPTEISRHSAKCVWWRGSCGHNWNDKVHNRSINKKTCTVCEKEFNILFEHLLIRYYASLWNEKILFHDDDLIGLPLDAFLPGCKLVFLLSENSTISSKKERMIARNLCEIRGVVCVTIPRATLEEKCTVIKQAFAKVHKFISSENDTDIAEVRKIYSTIKTGY